ncbi:tRNA methyltransferase [Cyathus striatus]|nr:tRNA methyltransferase [Cyathus striatus]
MSTSSAISIPDGFILHTENTSSILVETGEAFLNPVQEFNRDLSVACIRVWSEELNESKELKWRQTREKKYKKSEASIPRKKIKAYSGESSDTPIPQEVTPSEEANSSSDAGPKMAYNPYKVVILEALSATGLRAIRYAKEIPLVKHVIANDLSTAAVETMKRNVEINNLGESSITDELNRPQNFIPAKVWVNQGDACTLMYTHREEKKRVDVVDLDPYGTAAPFIDAAVQSVNDGGLLCVTCTDLAVLATTNNPEKCFSNYGGIPLKAEYCHEAALRLVLHAISTSASRYGRYIEPILSLSIDFYVRVFVKVNSAPIEVKKALAKTSTYYVCTSCQSSFQQPLGKMIERVHEASGSTNLIFKTQAGPSVPQVCTECESPLHLAGPMWSGPLHKSEFVGKVLEHLDGHLEQYGTGARMKGMLTVAKEELDVPFYFTPAKVAGIFHCQTPSLDDVASALLNAGHKISRSHACPGSLKTTAGHREIHDIFRSWIKQNPVRIENIKEGSPARRLLSKELRTEANFTRHPGSVTASGKVKLLRYQDNPRNWGPAKKAVMKSSKRKREDDTDETISSAS